MISAGSLRFHASSIIFDTVNNRNSIYEIAETKDDALEREEEESCWPLGS